jgi:hypothetical protein
MALENKRLNGENAGPNLAVNPFGFGILVL